MDWPTATGNGDLKMTKTFSTFANRKDRALVAFSSDDNAALKADICTNAANGYVRQLNDGGPISVPAHAANEVAGHLAKMGWVKA
jgi:hypothetical protein